ncbi:MAG TPA: ATP-dependent DNA helicase RecG, partial [Vicinamibacterales bacterium]
TLKPGQAASVTGELLNCALRPTRRPGFRIFEALVRDASGAVRVAWLNQPFLRDVLHPHQRVILFGQVEQFGQSGVQLTNPQYEILDDEEGETIHTGRIVAIYEKTGSLTPKMQRRLVHDALERLPVDLEDPLPSSVRERRQLPSRRDALERTHFPEAGASIDVLNQFRSPAQVRLIVEEFFLFQLGLLARRRDLRQERKPQPVVVDDRIRDSARRVLPFHLTGGQRQALKDIVQDMQRPEPMNRLLEGDVGSGKTIVALLAAIVAMENGLQVAFMAPTEILAEQHAANLRRLLAGSTFRLELLRGGRGRSRARSALLADIAAGQVPLVVGTHALVQESVRFASLGLVIIDEQHRFGVVQRAILRAKGLHPDVLVMTATPIPRTLALTAYGDLDVSAIREAPPGRLPIKTVAKPDSRRDEVYSFIRRELDTGHQAYIVYPLVEESAKVDLKAATEMADHLAQEIFPAYRVALLHGRMRADAKERVMQAFAAREVDVLVATTVIEVGIDVPNATVMVIEHAERFGLAQLHQLRGRVGRGGNQSACILLYQAPLSDDSRARLRVMTETTDGAVIAERDLEQRGPGDFFGTRQSGMPTLRVGNLLRDRTLMEDARREAAAWLDAADPSSTSLESLRRTWAERFGLIGVG